VYQNAINFWLSNDVICG